MTDDLRGLPDIPVRPGDLDWMTPMSRDRARALVGFLAAGRPRTVADLGCGSAGLLLDVLDAVPRATGLGIDEHAGRIDAATARASERGLTDRVDLRCGDAGAPLDRVDALIVIGASQIWGPPVEDGLPLDYAAALRAMRSRVRAGGRVVYGEAIWSTPPTPAATAAFSGRDDEYVDLAGLVELAQSHGFVAAGIGEATLDEWDVFESGFTVRWARWLAERPADHPAAPVVRRRLRAQQEAYLRGYRGVLGMAYLQLLAV